MAANDDRIITLNAGVGRDSTTMLCLLCEGLLEVKDLGTLTPLDIDVVVFSDTGCEWPHTYELVPRLHKLCTDNGIPFIVLAKPPCKPDPKDYSWITHEPWTDKIGGGAYHYRLGVLEDYRSRETVVSLGKGDCTDNHKIQPIRRFVQDLSVQRFGLTNRQYSGEVRKGVRDPHVNLIGIAADETRRLSNAGRSPAYVTELYPLVDMGIPKDDEAAVLSQWGLNGVKKSGCFVCPYQPAGWWWALSVSEPELWQRAVEYETTALARNAKMSVANVKVAGDLLTIDQVVHRWRERNPRATVEAVLAKSYTQCPAEARADMKGLSE